MRKKASDGTIEVVNGLECKIPPLPPKEQIAWHDLPQEDQLFRVTELPAIFKNLPRGKEEEYMTQEHWDFVDQEWERRINGYWFYNNGVPTYITGAHYMYINYWKHSGTLMTYRNVDRNKFLFWKACEEDPDCMGMIEVSRRRLGKSAFSGFIIYEYVSRTSNANGGIQSKTNKDSEDFFQKNT